MIMDSTCRATKRWALVSRIRFFCSFRTCELLFVYSPGGNRKLEHKAENDMGNVGLILLIFFLACISHLLYSNFHEIEFNCFNGPM